MAYDIGPKLGIDGFADFKSSIAYINEEIKGLGSELKLVAASYDESGSSMEALTEQNKILEKTYDAQEKKIAEVSKLLERARAEYGENSESVKKWERVLTDSKTALVTTEKAMEQNRKAMDKLENATEDVEEAFEDVADSVKDADKALDKLGDSAKNSSGKFDAMKVAAGNLVSGGISAIAGAVGNAVSSLANLDESTEEYRTSMGLLNTAFESQGYSAEIAGEAYEGLYAILGDTGTATEAAQLMAQLADSEEDFAEWTNIAAGVAGVFGESLPVNNMAEFLTETVKTGEVTGDLTRLLQEAGINTEEFQAQLDACSTESERNTLLMETLSSAYGEAADAFYENNEALIKSREAQAQLDEATGKLGESVAGVKNALMEKFGPALADVAEKAADFINNVDTEKLFKKFDEAVDGISNAFEWGWDKISGIYDLAPSYFDNKADAIGHTFDVVENLWNGDFEGAWESVLDITTDNVAALVGGAKDIKEMFSDIDWSVDFEDAWNGIVEGFKDTWENVKNIAHDIGEAVQEGYEKANQGPNVTVSGTRGDNSAYWDNYRSSSSSSGSGSRPVYLDGRPVGKILDTVNEISEIASGVDISTLP